MPRARRGLSTGAIATVFLLGLQSPAHASDMGMFGPYACAPIEVLAIVAFLLIGDGARAGEATARTQTVLHVLGLMSVAPGAFMSLIAAMYLVQGSYWQEAAVCLGIYVAMVASYVSARNAIQDRRFEWDREDRE